MKLNQTGKDNPFWKGGKSTYNCLECGKEFKAYASERARGGAKFCSAECGYENKRRRVKCNCESCGKEVEKKRHEYDREERHFCSNVCFGKWASHNLVGENNHSYGKKFSYEHRKKIGDGTRGEKHYNWKGGTKSKNQQIRKQMDYRDWRTMVFGRDVYTCQLCGQKGGYLEAHHILGFASYPECRFKVDNGITYCKEGHDIIGCIEKAGDIFQPLPAHI